MSEEIRAIVKTLNEEYPTAEFSFTANLIRRALEDVDELIPEGYVTLEVQIRREGEDEVFSYKRNIPASLSAGLAVQVAQGMLFENDWTAGDDVNVIVLRAGEVVL